jgi:hypothetical protein
MPLLIRYDNVCLITQYIFSETKLGGIKVLTTYRMKTDTFNSIVKLGSGLKKKKKKGGKKVFIQNKCSPSSYI